MFPGQELLVCDLGTACTYDIVSAEGVFVGGNIAPGAGMRLRALHHYTCRLPEVSSRGTVTEFGTDTQTAMRSALPPALRRAAGEAVEVLGTTGDPQLADFLLDRAYYAEMLSAAEATGSSFLVRYVQATIDASNLRGAVRTLRMKKGADMLRRVLVEGGTIRADSIQTAALGGSLEELYRSTNLRQAAELGAAAVNGGSLTAFEKACDNAVTAVAAQAKSVPFGVEAVVSFLAAKEIEFTAVRIIMSGRMAGISGDTIRERLREAYV